MSEAEWVGAAVADALRPGNFFAAPSVRLEWEHVATEDTPWEVHRGRLMARNLSREYATFESFNIHLWRDGERSGEPLVSLKLDAAAGKLHIVRGLLSWVWEGYDAGGNVYLSREVPRWVRELVGTVDLAAASDLRTELAGWIFAAVVGLSRLPLTSVEAPIPAFSLGEVAHVYRPGSGERPLTSWRELLACRRDGWPQAVRTKWLEFLLRATPAAEIADLAAAWDRGPTETVAQLRAVFNDVALSPYTDFVDKTLAFAAHLPPESHADFLARLLRQLAHHLTAYDLVTFHHRGANYPDALLLDAALKRYLCHIESNPALFDGDAGLPRRRALCLAWLHRRRYEGHPVPDAPTSPGENARVLPPPHVRVPDEQILNLGKRKKRLYAGDPLPNHLGEHGRHVLLQCGRDLERPEELRELGTAIFIERPLSGTKAPGEPDPSPLLAHEGYSRSLAERALLELGREPLFGLSADDINRHRATLAALEVKGVPASALPTEPPRVVSLADAVKAAPDFVIVRTLPGSARAFWERPEAAGLPRREGVMVGGVTAKGTPGVLLYDPNGKLLGEFA
jgi:hypothetical protein